MVAERAGWPHLLVMAGLGCLGFGCGSDDRRRKSHELELPVSGVRPHSRELQRLV